MTGDPGRELGADEPIHDLLAERYLLSACMRDPMAVEEALGYVTPEHFYRPAHGVIFQALVQMTGAEKPIDPVTLMGWLEDTGEMRPLGADGPLYLMALWEARLDTAPQSAGYHAAKVLDMAARRTLEETGLRVARLARDRTRSPHALVTEAQRQLGKVLTVSHRDRPLVNAAEFSETEFPYDEWVISGMVCPQDRLVIVGPEGSGKTTLAHQVAYTTAAGIHPFAWSTGMRPRKVLIMDFENPGPLLQRRLRRLQATAEQYPHWDPSRVLIHHQPAGANLSDPREAFALAQVIKRAEPDLIVAGPIYKLLGDGGEDRKMGEHRKVAAFFDAARDRLGCALWLEAHAPYAARDKDTRPEGSNLWAKWPEFGLTLRWGTKAHGGKNALEVGSYRGHREEGRVFPTWITRNMTPGGWPWVGNWGEGVLDTPMMGADA